MKGGVREFFSTIGEGSLGDDYEQLSEIARGSFGRVIRVRQKFGSKQVRAIKQIQVDPMSESQFDQVKKLKFLKHDHIVQYFGYILEGNQLNIVMEYCKGNLGDKMKGKGQFSRKELIDLVTQVTSAMLMLSSKNIMHLDLKPENILLVEENFYKICDFGCSQLISNISKAHFNKSIVPLQMQNAQFGTPEYIAPEIQLDLKRTASNACDVWSLGVLLYKIIYGCHPIGLNKLKRMQSIDLSNFVQSKYNIEFKPTQIDYPLDLLKSMLQPKPEKRITWKKIKEYLITNCNRDESEFIDIEQAAKSQILMSIILANVVMTIDDNLEHNGNHFWFNNMDLLKQIKRLLVKLGVLLIEKFYDMFGYKMKLRLSASTFGELRFMLENLSEEAKGLPIQIKKEEKNLVSFLEKSLKQKLERVKASVESHHSQWQSLKKLSTFCDETLKVKSLYCNGHKFPQTCEIFEIEGEN